MMTIQKYNFHFYALYILLFVVMTDGIFIALLKFFHLNLMIDPMLFLSLMFYPYLIVKAIQNYQISFVTKVISLFLICFVLFLFIKLLYYADEMSLYSLSLSMFYINGILFIYAFYDLNEVQTKKLLNTIVYFGFFLIGIAYLQLIFYDQLPQSFVEIPVLDSSKLTLTYKRDLSDLIIFQPNGLFSNPIVFGSFCLLIYTLQYSFFLKKKNITNFFKLIIIFLMIFLLFSRINFIVVILITIIPFLSIQKLKYLILIFLFTMSLIVFLSDASYEINVLVSYMYDRLAGNDDWALASNNEHINDYKIAINLILDNLFFGIPIGKNFIDNIITDGSWFIFMLEFGSIVFTFFIAIWFLLIYLIFKLEHKEGFTNLIFSFFLLITITNFFNSFLIDKKVYLLIWMLMGIMLNFHRIHILRKNIKDD